MTTTVNTHFGGNIKWEVFKKGHNEIQFLLKYDGIPVDLSDRTFTVRFRVPGSETDVLTLAETSGITKDAENGILVVELTATHLSQYLSKRSRWFMQIEYEYNDKLYPLVQGYVHLLNELNTLEAGRRVIINGATPQTVTLNVTFIGEAPEVESFDETFDETFG